jgi:TolA-binding protein
MNFRAKKCPQPKALNKAFTDGLDRSLSEHLQSCERCASEWRALERIVSVAQTLPAEELSDERKVSVRRKILFSAEAVVAERQIPAWPWLRWVLAPAAVVAGLACAIMIWQLISFTPPAQERIKVSEMPHYRATIHAQPGTQFVRIGAQPDEIVRLYEGAITAEVESLQPGERFRVISGDAEIEVRGTSFEAQVKLDRLAAVRVFHGRVEVRPVSSATRLLNGGERWEVEALNSTPPTTVIYRPEEAASKTKPVRVAKVAQTPLAMPIAQDDERGEEQVSDRKQVLSPSEDELAFQKGWSALRVFDHEQAAREFQKVSPKSSLGEDAAFWNGITLLRAGRKDEGARALTAFLSAYPQSARLGEVSIALGWILLEQGDLEEARICFETALNDRGKDIRESAGRGLEEIAHREETR